MPVGWVGDLARMPVPAGAVIGSDVSLPTLDETAGITGNPLLVGRRMMPIGFMLGSFIQFLSQLCGFILRRCQFVGGE